MISSNNTKYFRSDGTIHNVILVGESITPRLIFEKREHSGHGSMRVEDDRYYLVAYDASLAKKPIPSREIAAILFLTDENMREFIRNDMVTLSDILKEGAEIIEQEGEDIPREAILAPYGAALYMVRSIGADNQ